MTPGPRHSVVLFFGAVILVFLAFQILRDSLLSQPSPEPTAQPVQQDEPLRVDCSQDSDCGSNFFCLDGTCSEYLYDTACKQDSDCLMINTANGYGCCWSGACDQPQYQEDAWIAVNADSFQTTKQEFCPTEESCGPAPSCPETANASGITAGCRENVCIKLYSE